MIYADYNGSAPLTPSVRAYLKRRLDSDLFANPNAIHSLGQKIFTGLEKCRELIAGALGAFPDQITFTSGASEGVSTVIRSVLEATSKKVILTSPIEHAAVSEALGYYEAKGFRVIEVAITEAGQVELKDLEKLLKEYKDQVALIAIMAANNETGVIQPYREIAKLAAGVPFFCDTTQLIGKDEFNFEKSGVDFAVCAGHKLGALTGTGLIISKDPTLLRPLIFGKNQEKGLRGGTQNYIGIETLAVAFQDFVENKHKLPGLREARLRFEAAMKEEFKDVRIIGDGAPRLAGTTLIGYPGIHGQAVQIELESNDIFVTTSAACADNQPETSAVLKAMGVEEHLGRSVVRISLSYSHGEHEYSALARALKHAYNKLTKIHSF